MGSTYQSLIENYTGTISDTTQLSDQLSAGAKFIINTIPENKLDKYASASTDSGSGVSVDSMRIVRAHKGGYRARQIDPGLKTQVLPSGGLSTVAIVNGGSGYTLNDVLTLTTGGSSGTCKVTSVAATVVTGIEILTAGSGYSTGVSATTVAPSGGTNCTIYVIPTNSSIHQATTLDPVWYVENTKAYVIPSGGTVIGVTYPSVTYSGDWTSTPTGFPDDLKQGIVLYAVVQVLLGKTNTTLATLEAVVLDTVTAPTAPADASYTYTDASLGTFTATTIAALEVAPAYTKPTCTLVDAPLDLTISAVAPTPPSSPTFSWTDAVLGTYTPTVVGDLGTVPAYTKPTISVNFPSVPTAFSFSINVVIPTAPNAPAITWSDGTLGTYTATTIAALPTAPTYTKPSTTASFTNTGTYIATNQDLAKAQTEIQHQNAILELYGKDLYNELNEFNAQLEEYKAGVQKVIRQAELDQERILKLANDETNLNLQNAIHAASTSLQNYQLSLNRYLAQIDSYGKVVESEVRAYVTNLDRFRIDRETLLTQYNLDIQNELNEFNKELAVYQSTVQKAIEDARLAQQRILQNAGDAKEVNIQNEIYTLNEQVQEYQASLGLFNEQLTLYAHNINKEVQQYQTNLQKWTITRQTQLQLYSNDIQNELNEFNKELAVYQSIIQKEIEQARLDQERLMLTANKTTDLSIQNKAKDLEKQIANAHALLEKYSLQVNAYGVSTNKAVGKYQSDIQKYLGEVQANTQLIEQVKKEFQMIVGVQL